MVAASDEVSALVWLGGSEFAIRQFDLPIPAVGEAVVEIDLATVCGSDLHTVSGLRHGPHPSILGHEAVGRIVALGPGGRTDERGEPLAVGDRVVWGVTASCGDCDRCLVGHTAKCRHLAKTGHEPLNGAWPLSGSYATHLLVHRGLAVVRVPETVSDAAAAMSACALATVMACAEAAGDLVGRRVVVSGLGMLGLTACAVASESGAAHVEGRDPDAARRAQALAFGADSVMDPAADTAPDLCDVAIELSGAAAAVTAAIDLVDIGGRVVLAGSVAPQGTVPVDPERLVRGLITVVGVHNYEPRHLRRAVEFLSAHPEYPFGSVIAEPVRLDELPELLTRQGGPVVRSSVAPSRRM